MTDDHEDWLQPLWDDDDESDDSSEVLADNGVSEVVKIQTPDGIDFLIVKGGDSGAIVHAPPAGSTTSPGLAGQIPNRDEALSSGRPLFLFTAGQRNHVQGNEVLSRLYAEHGDHLSVGVIASIPRHNAKKIHDTFNCDVAAVRIADPEGFKSDRGSLILASENADDYNNEETGKAAEKEAKRLRERAPYLDRVGDDDYIAQVLDAQRAAGANLLLTSGRALHAADLRKTLDGAVDEGNTALELLRDGERLALNLTIPFECMINGNYLEVLLNELVEQDQFDIWYVRVQWRRSTDSAQPIDSELIKGYKELCNLSQDEERLLILPQTGLTGWYLMAHGAAGFGTGTSGTGQGFWEHRPVRRRKGATNAERLFESSLLHSVEYSTHQLLETEPDYRACECRWCDALSASGVFNQSIAEWHGVYNQGILAATISRDSRAGGYAGSVRRIVKAAQEFADGKALAGREEPKHIPVWRQHL
ncbi:hypothetical protein GCM10023194_40780 [Planotetraspora phitsanulokensis]|uniref:Uncharacterized protein n=1 Tax=Planotetraspora phitsanulokensis TaxID=575192 RepID=A0A8J3UEL0_9ACTN|nr:hypothetical protein [Planotetraspora phitsanulokensis]GII40934.1 hypothetical protein Pph01_59370 [Planotetraspora phitsanulokensis]